MTQAVRVSNRVDEENSTEQLNDRVEEDEEQENQENEDEQEDSGEVYQHVDV